MAMASWMIRGRSTRSNRSHKSRLDSEDNCVQLDLSKDVKENVQEVLTNLCQRQGISSARKLAYLNAIVKLISENDILDYGYCVQELFCCLRIGLVNEATQVRAAALRAVRYMLRREQDIIALNKLQYPYLVARSMDLNLRNEIERIQALRLVRRILLLAPKHFSPALARSLISLTNGGIEEKDPIFRAFLAAVCELGVLNSNLLISCGGVGALTRAAMTEQSPAITESVVGVLLKLLGNPETRSGVSLLCLAAPYCELHSAGIERTKQERRQRFTASKLALLSVLRSYTGIIHFCHPNDSSGLKAIAGILYVEQLEVRGAVLELLYELLGLPLPAWTDEPDVALAAVDPSRTRESWRLSEGFVGAEGRAILPPLSKHRPNIVELHLALLVYALLECGLHKALAETIVTSDTFISVRAAVLLGALLHLAHALLPPEACDLTPPLPNLLEHASAGRHQALAAVAILGRMHTVMRRRPAPASLFLDRVLQAGTWLRPTLPRRQKSTGRHWLRRESPTTPLLRDAHVLSSKDALAWNWPVVRSILRSRDDALRKLQDSDHRLFIKRLVRYFKPSYNQYSRVELGTNATLAREATLAGCDLINCLLELHEPEGNHLLTDLVGDIAEQIAAIKSMESAHDCLFSPRHMSTTCCQKYFLFLGQLSHSAKGTVVLNRFHLLEKLQDLALATNHDCYVKLITSSLDYSREGTPRKVFATITCDSPLESTRLYATQFLRVILRAQMSDAHNWAIGLLWGRLRDTSRTVALAALEALHEACDDVENLEVLFQQREENGDWTLWLDHLGDRGYLLKIRLYSLHSVFGNLPSPSEELDKWISPGGFAERYVGVVDGEIHDSLTRRQRGENGTYHRRSSQIFPETHDVFVPPHLLGQLVQHDAGIELLLRRNVLHRFVHLILRFLIESGNSKPELLLRGSRGSRLLIEDGYLLSEESGTDNIPESSRLETIIDYEDTEGVEVTWRNSSPYKPWKTESLVEFRRKSSFDDSRRMTPEKWWRLDIESREDRSADIDNRILKVKSALWALGHVGTSMVGVELLNNLEIIGVMASMAESCPHYSVRATAMYALSLIATTRFGADTLASYDWPCVKHKRGDQWPVVPPRNPYPLPSPVPMQKHHRSLSDGKAELPDPIIRRSRNRSESAATDLEARRYPFLELGDTPSPVASALRLSQQDADGYARLRNLYRHRRPSYSQSSLEMQSLDGRLSQLSFTDLDPPRSWAPESIMAQTPPPENGIINQCYMGICLPRVLTTIFPDPPRPAPSIHTENVPKQEEESIETGDEMFSANQTKEEHARICLICDRGKIVGSRENGEGDGNSDREILRHVECLANPVWYRNSRQALLRLRQQCPKKFQATCLFSEVGARLASGTYRLQARQFLQELFLESQFDDLYAEPLNILRIPNSAEQQYLHPKHLRSPLDNVLNKPVPVTPENKLNGRSHFTDLQLAFLPVVSEEISTVSQSSLASNKTNDTSIGMELRSDEKIIAEILKPEERIRISKSSDKLLKTTNTSTAFSLD
ncbi:rapamycin-insensitive companion of mTOR [Athalia rosae]|uniref:rapamycin-insensitive companion of mTOR n=1 Tax=Athalia rosae TaxID=37344 RepID=UPI0020339461|nr:rapamycin-insensitive companion of mTOR [Athalia rosae]XP_048505643.1 rapamycin-insensitive companion of mTOR [Athalia rosae]